jgi:hypothetical protein
VNVEQPAADATDAVFVRRMFALRLGRVASDSDVAAWTDQLHNGLSLQNAARGIEESPEARYLLVRKWYANYFGRVPSVDNLGAFVNWMQAGATEEQALAALLGSGEYVALSSRMFTSGTPDERYVRALFQQILGRAPSSTELATWVNLKPTQNAQQVALSFLKSTEARGRLVTGIYNAYLGRDPDATTLSTLVKGTLNYTQLRETVEGSMEFYDVRKAAATRVTFSTSLTAQLQGQLLDSTDRQFFFLTVGRNQFLNLTVQGTAGASVKVQLEDEVGNVIAETRPDLNVNKLRGLVQPGHTYYLRVLSAVATPASFTLNLLLVQ